MSDPAPVKSILSDQDLVLQAIDGSIGAFNELVLRYQALLYNVAYRTTGNEDLAADATQEAFLRAFRKLKQYRGGSLRAWLARIATNCAYDQLRTRSRHQTSSVEDLVEEEDRFPGLRDPGISPEEAALSAELRDALAEAVAKLPPDQRSVLVLVDYNQFDYDEAAEALELTLGTVKSRLSRARAKVRAHLVEYHPELLPGLKRH